MLLDLSVHDVSRGTVLYIPLERTMRLIDSIVPPHIQGVIRDHVHVAAAHLAPHLLVYTRSMVDINDLIRRLDEETHETTTFQNP